MIGLEPSCTAVFRDELTEMLPQNEDARRLQKQTFTLDEFLMKRVPNYRLPKLQRKAVVHGHCHHKAIMKLVCEIELLKGMGVDFHEPQSGCCGMAGAFGFEKEHFDVSIACAERVLLPEVRKASKDTLIIADGFSCQEQVRQGTDRVPLHIAQVLKMAIDEGPRGPAGNFPEAQYITRETRPVSIRTVAGVLVAGVVLGAVILRALKRKR